MASRTGRGRPRLFCRPACRQAAYRARRLAAGHGLADDEVIVREGALEALADVDQWIAKQKEPGLTRPEAIRRLVELGLKARAAK